MEQASFRESIEFYGQAFGSSSSCASAQPASPSGDNLGGWRNAIHFRINSTMQKIATVGSSQANRIRTLFITFAFAMVQTVLSLVDSGAAMHVKRKFLCQKMQRFGLVHLTSQSCVGTKYHQYLPGK
jgi:hypothetical protein